MFRQNMEYPAFFGGGQWAMPGAVTRLLQSQQQSMICSEFRLK